jgi:hypothetical protein
MSNDDVFVVEGNGFSQYDSEGDKLGGKWGGPEGSYEGISASKGIAVDPVTHDVWVANKRTYPGGQRVERFERVNPTIIPDTTVAPAELDNPNGTTAVLKGAVNPDGVETTDCYFEYGPTKNLGVVVDCAEGDNFAGDSDVAVSAEVPVELAERYYYRLSAKNANDWVARSVEGSFIAQGVAKVQSVHVDRVNTDGARMSADINPNGGNTTYHFEWGLKGEGFVESGSESEPFGFEHDTYKPGFHPQSYLTTGLEQGKTYEYRLVATNEAGSTISEPEEFTTYVPDPGIDSCPNSHPRQQTSASLIPDCRAYELVSSSYTGGYDVVSDIVPGQAPFFAQPRAKDKLLYSIHFGVVPGISGSPTNLGRDPYLATRDPESGWTTRYVGLPADAMPDTGKFGSPLLGSDASLRQFAFGGTDICSPCFKDGLGESTNVPLRLDNGELVKGMAGSLNPHADPVGYVAKPFSDDGSHFIFGADEKFHPAGKDGEVSIYDRNLDTGATQVSSTLPDGSTMSGDVGQLDISRDAGRIVVGERISTDSSGNGFWHPYMHIGSSANSVDLAPGTTSGVLYNGMSGDGSRVFFTTKDKLLGADTDASADIYEAEVDGGGALSLRLITLEGATPRNDDSCEPPGEPNSWNAVEGEDGKCDPVAFAGGAGIASESGTFYFMSPELLDEPGNGEQDEVNLYLVPPGGAPEFVATTDSSTIKPPPLPPQHPVVSTSFITALSTPEGVAVDQFTGDIYIAERGSGGRIARFDSTGAPKNFAVPGGSNRIANAGIGGQGEAQVAFDSAPASPLKGSIYARNGAGTVAVYAESGEKVGSLTGFSEACGVAVDPSGVLYVGDYSFGGVRRFEPVAVPSIPIEKDDYTETSVKTLGINPCAVGAGATTVYAIKYNSGPLVEIPVSEFAAVPPNIAPETLTANARAVNTDPENSDVYVSEANQIAHFNAAGELQQKFGFGSIGNNARGVAVEASTGVVYVQFGTSIVKFGYEEPPYEPIDNRSVVNGVHNSEARTFEDIQITPDGRYAVFNSRVPLTEYPTQGHEEIYRYDSLDGEIHCASCPPSRIAAQNDTSLSRYGLNLSDDGRVFFTTLDELALRDANGRLDVYEWDNGALGLVSTGVGEEDSGLVTVSADGKDVFFYTRDELHAFDENGRVVKIYTARSLGGIPVDPPRLRCAASDECHGPGTKQPPPPDINTHNGLERRESESPDESRCARLENRAKRADKRADKMLRQARRSSSAKQERALQRHAKRQARKARGLSRRARACRQSSRGNGS